MSFLTGNEREPDNDPGPTTEGASETPAEPTTDDTATAEPAEPEQPGGDIQAGRGGFGDPKQDQA